MLLDSGNMSIKFKTKLEQNKYMNKHINKQTYKKKSYVVAKRLQGWIREMTKCGQSQEKITRRGNVDRNRASK